MVKHFTFAVLALFGFASISLAASPFDARAFSEAPSILVKSDDASAAPVESSETGVVHDSAMVDGPAASSTAAPDQGEMDESAVPAESSAPIVTSSPAPVYRSAKPSRRQSGGLFSELIELERRKNAWLRKNILGR